MLSDLYDNFDIEIRSGRDYTNNISGVRNSYKPNVTHLTASLFSVSK